MADGAGGPGARAATTDDARAMLKAAWLREQTDGRARRAPRSLYWACLFLSGARFGEPSRWRWSDLILDEDPASILWNDQNQKANRRDEIVICPELAGLLRAWRGVCDQESPPGADFVTGPVFPVAPHKRSWADDRARAGLPRNDSRGRCLSAHSARKWYKTELVRAGVHADLIDRLMRHSSGVGSRYYDPTAAEMAAAVGLLPKIWPTQIIEPQAFTTLAPKCGRFPIDKGGERADALGAKTMTDQPHTSHSEPSPSNGPHGLSSLRSQVGLGSLCDLRAGNGEVVTDNGGSDFRGGGVDGDTQAAARQCRSGQRCNSNSPNAPDDSRVRTGPPLSPGRDAQGHRRENDLADMLESIARLIRGCGR